MTASTCKGCSAPIWWVTTAANGKAMPLDPDPCDDGNVTLNPDGKAVVHPRNQPTLDVDADRYRPHWATCPRLPSDAKEAADAGS